MFLATQEIKWRKINNKVSCRPGWGWKTIACLHAQLYILMFHYFQLN